MDLDGAPGNGNWALYQSMVIILNDDGNPVMTSRQEARFLVKGMVRANQPVQGKSEVAIIGRVTLRDGIELGQITQNNIVPVGALYNRLSRLAFTIAEGASQGIKVVVRRAEYRNESQPRLEIPFREKTLGDSES